MGETRVDLLHLLEDLRDAYPASLEETILTEIVANSIDSGAQRIRFLTEATEGRLTVADDGSGMKRRELARYHDVAASTKSKGEGIGFAGVGIKLGLLVASQVTTETRQKKTHVATAWGLSSRRRAPWKWIEPPGLVGEHGTAVRLRLENALSPLLDPGFIESTLLRHFQPLFDASFHSILAPHYPHGVRFEINGAEPAADEPEGEAARIEVRMGRKRKPSAAGYLVRYPFPRSDGSRGVGISTLGKVIKTGWDWLGVSPSDPDRIGGLIEVPALAACLTLNKADFLTSGTHRAVYLGYRKALQEAVNKQLAVWGDSSDANQTRKRALRPVERDLERVLMDLSYEFPLLSTLVEQHSGGQRRLPIGHSGEPEDARALVMASIGAAEEEEKESPGSETRPTQPAASERPPEEREKNEEEEEPPPATTQLPGASGPRKPRHYGLRIEYENRPDELALARLLESTVYVNQAHPAHLRAVASRSEGYHVALSVGLALAPLVVEPEKVSMFLNNFLARWGEVLGDRGKAAGRNHGK